MEFNFHGAALEIPSQRMWDTFHTKVLGKFVYSCFTRYADNIRFCDKYSLKHSYRTFTFQSAGTVEMF